MTCMLGVGIYAAAGYERVNEDPLPRATTKMCIRAYPGVVLHTSPPPTDHVKNTKSDVFA